MHTRYLVLLAAALLVALPAGAQWVQQGPFPTNRQLYTAGLVTPERGCLGGTYGTLLCTEDGGGSWEAVAVNPEEPIYTVRFVDDQVGYAGTNSGGSAPGLYRTTDGGRTWAPVPGFPLGGSWRELSFPAPGVIFAGSNGAIARSTDDGQTWAVASGYPHAPVVNGMSFRDAQTGLAVGLRVTPYNDEGIYRTADGGQTWTLVSSTPANDVFWLSATEAVALGGAVVRSTDGGLTWTTTPAPISVMDAELLADGALVGVSEFGDVWRSADGGHTWVRTRIGNGDLPAAWGIGFSTAAHGFAVGPYGQVFVTENGGATWAQFSNGLGVEFYGAAMFDAYEGLMGGTNGYLLRTTDGGARWEIMRLQVTGVTFSPPRYENIYDLHIVDDQFVVASGRDGVVYKSADRGATWTSIGYPRLSTSYDIGDVHFVSRTEGWVTGLEVSFPQRMEVYHTTNGGQSWTRVPGVESRGEVEFVGANGWIAWSTISSYRTTDGGQTWVPMAVPLVGPERVAGMRFVSPTHGYLIAGARLLVTTNAGQTWSEIPTGNTSHAFTDLSVNGSHLWISTVSHRLYHSPDGGQTWAVEDIGIPHPYPNIYAIATVEGERVWGVGYWGQLYARNPPAAAPVAVSAAPVGGPVVIGPGGGSFQFRVTLTNTTGQPQSVQAWTAVTGPVGREPVVGPQSVTLPPGATVVKTLTQRVPANAPAGTYTYHVRLGTFPSTVTASASFPFTKQGAEAAAHGDDDLAGWAVSGTLGGDATAAASSALPEGFALSEAQPNPSGGRTRLTLEVAEAQHVRAEVFDALGRRVAVLADGAVEAGVHGLVFDGAGLPAGVYVVRVTGETFAATRRVTLLR